MSTAMSEINADFIMKSVGEMGRYQKFLLIVLIIPTNLLFGWSFYSFIFLLHPPDHQCKNISPQNFMANLSVSQCTFSYINANDSLITQICSEWTYSGHYFESNAVTRFDLVCQRKFYANLLTSICMGVSTVNLLIAGWIQNKYGSKVVLYIQLTAYLLGTLPTIFVENFITFAILRTLAFSCSPACWTIGYIYTMELMGPTKRTWASTAMGIADSISAVLLGIVAYLFNNYTSFTLATSVPFLIMFPLYPLIVKSPRWLMSKGRISEAKNVFKKIAKRNGIYLNDNDIEDVMMQALPRHQMVYLQGIAQEEPSRTTWVELKRILRRPKIQAAVVIISLSYCVVSTVYDCVAYNIKNIGGNLFVTFGVLALAEMPSMLTAMCCLDRFGRIWPMTGGCLLTSVFCFLTLTSPVAPGWVIVFLAFLAKYSINISFQARDQVSAEVLPTESRGLLTSLTCFFGFLGHVTIPYIVDLSTINKDLPMVCLAILCIIIVPVLLCLPETLSKRLPETLAGFERSMPIGWVAFKGNVDCCNRRYRERISTSFFEQAPILDETV